MVRRKPHYGLTSLVQIGFDGLVWAAPLLIAAVFLGLLGHLLVQGWGVFWSGQAGSPVQEGIELFRRIVQFLTTAPQQAGRAGGIGPILVSTGLILLVCLSTSLPIAVGTAMLLSEWVSQQSGFGRLVRRSLDVLAGVPSIVFGLFGNVFFCQVLGLGFSILSGGLTLACMILPLLIRATEEGFRAVPQGQRQAAAALGFSRSTLLWKILLPQAMPGIAVGLILGIGRALAETAALIFTSGYVDRMPGSLWDSGRSLSIHIYDLAMNVPGGNPQAYATALVLIGLLIVINVSALQLTRRWLPGRGAIA